MNPYDRAGALLVRLCAEVGFTPPQEGAIVDWADTVLDSPLAPRGSTTWYGGQALVLDAYEAALADNESMCRACLVRARDYVREHGAKRCECERKTIPMKDGAGVEFCPACVRRR